MKNYEEYDISLNIGVNSVGYAVTNDTELIRFKGKNMWGVNLFQKGETAEQTRLFRTARRRYVRRRNRILLLQELLSEEVLKNDDSFFIRMKESFLHKKDKSINVSNGLFIDQDFKDKDFFDKYPTIYHLREDLINSDNKIDIRLIYLAIHHIIKYRGNFLYEGQSFNVTSGIEDMFLDMVSYFKIEKVEYKDFENILTNEKLSKKDKEKELKNLFTEEKNQQINNLIRLMLGYKADIVKIFDIEDVNDKVSISFSEEGDDGYNEAVELLESKLEEDFYIFESLKKIYGYLIISDLLKNSNSSDEENTISRAMIEKYNEHSDDLVKLKKIYKEFIPHRYSSMFRHDNGNGYKNVKNYNVYINNISKCTREELYKAIKKDIADIKEPEVEEILNKIGNEKFLLKLNSTENAQVPYQLNLAELESIIDNQGQYYPILKMNKDKIISILKFRIPYYVGPLNRNNDNKRIFAWMERKSKDKIYPWNFEEVVDLEKSAENFILKMTNQCSYFPDCDVLPNNSLLYSEYKVLNELNKVRIDGKLLSTQVKLMMLCDLLRKEKNVTEKMIVKFLKNKGVIEKSDNPLIQGMQGEKRLANNLKSHIFFESLGFDVDGKDRETVENIIRWVTLFTDKKILKKKIRDTYNSELISNEVLKKILKRDFKGWGSLSEKLIDGVTTTNKKFENGTILDILKISNMNFMQIISDENLGFNKIIEEKNSRVIEKITIEDIESLHGSPSIKRGIWQSVRMVEEIISIMKNQPRNIFIKVNKEEGPKRRTIPRINRVDNLYEEIKKSRILNIDEQIQEVIDKTKKDKGNIDDNKLYLYLLQNGKCMFTGENLVLEDLSKYRISYIIPKSIIEDNSISNKVLVKYAGNHRGPNGIIIKEDIRNNMKPLWDKMLRVKLISFKKYKNLTAYKFSKEHIENLMNKELVETRQITKHVANLFRNCYIDTDVVTVKATLVERLRRKYELFKVQNLNDFHYAHDSYLTGLLGTFLMKRFPTFRERFYFDVYDNFNFRESGAEYGFIIEEFGKDIKNHNLELVWNSKKIIEKMSKSLDYYDCFISYKKEEKVGGFYNQNPSAKSSGNLMPLKKGLDTELYGGFSQISKSYLLAVEGKRKNKVISTLANCPVVLRNRTMEEKIEYISRDKGLENLKILNDKIMLNQLILKDGMYQLLKSDIEIINAVQIVLPKGQKRVLYNIERKMYKNISSDEVTILFDVLMEKIERFYPVYNKIRGKLLENRGVFIDLSIIEKCQIILEILKLLQANSTRANFKILGLSSDVGRQTKIGIKLSELIFVERSVTGLYEKKWKVV